MPTSSSPANLVDVGILAATGERAEERRDVEVHGHVKATERGLEDLLDRESHAHLELGLALALDELDELEVRVAVKIENDIRQRVETEETADGGEENLLGALDVALERLLGRSLETASQDVVRAEHHLAQLLGEHLAPPASGSARPEAFRCR